MNNNHTYIYQFKPNTRKTYYWNGTGWSQGRSNGMLYTAADAEVKVRQMMLDSIHAKTGDIRLIK